MSHYTTGGATPVRMAGSAETVLAVDDVSVSFRTEDGTVRAVRGVSYDLHRGEVLGIVGESGSGKSVTSLAVMGLLPRTAHITGSVRLGNDELLGLSEHQLAHYRGQQLAMIFQDPMTSLNPVYTRRLANRGGPHRTPAPEQGSCTCSRGGVAEDRRHPERGGTCPQLPARVLRRNAATRSDRDRDRERPRGHHRGRADHRSRCHRAGAGARDLEDRPRRDGRRHDPDHPRPRRRRGPGRPGVGDVRRPRRRSRHRRGDLLHAADAVHVGPARQSAPP